MVLCASRDRLAGGVGVWGSRHLGSRELLVHTGEQIWLNQRLSCLKGGRRRRTGVEDGRAMALWTDRLQWVGTAQYGKREVTGRAA